MVRNKARQPFTSTVVSVRQHWFNRLSFMVLLGVVAIDVIWMLALKWDFDWHNIAILTGYIIATIGLVLFFTYFYREPTFALMLMLVLQFMLIPYSIASLNYVTSTLNLPLQDTRLIAIDHALGFDWLSYVTWVREHDKLALVYTICYSAAWFEFLLIAVLLFFTQKLDHLQRMTFAVMVGAMLTSVIFMLVPAMGGYWFFHIDPSQLPGHSLPAAGTVHIPDLIALRDGRYHYVDLHFQGIVTFPSFHTTFGLLLIYGAWPFRWLRPVIIVLNIMLVLSTPVDGGHYLVDVIGGGIIACGLMVLVNKLLPFSLCGALAQSRKDDYTVSPLANPS